MVSWPPLLDTGIRLAYARKGPLGVWIENTYPLMAMPEKPLISVVTHGELLSLVLQFGWGESKIRQLNELLEQWVIVDINDPAVLQSYAETDVYCRSLRPSLPMAKNDLWIAATAHALNVTLISTEKVFERLHPHWVNVISVNERVVKP